MRSIWTISRLSVGCEPLNNECHGRAYHGDDKHGAEEGKVLGRSPNPVGYPERSRETDGHGSGERCP